MAQTIKRADFHCQSNNAAHRTNEITTKQLVVRRGQAFLLTLETTLPSGDRIPLVLTVETGPAPSEKHGTRSEFGNPSPMYASDVKAIWKYSIDERSDRRGGGVTLSVTPPADAPVGKYSLSARTKTGSTALGSLVVLFNPWCSDDWVYLPDERERQEYVMNEQGIIFVGTVYDIDPRPWDFGQFEEEMVDICLKILDVNPKHVRDPADDTSARCNPIYVSRVISAMINSADDGGVLAGRWFGDFSDGVFPSRWVSSLDILKQWFDRCCHPVKYGQCWVFAGVMCSVMRFFGIPCRVVTNFESAHDTDSSLTIDQYYDDHGLRSDGEARSIWNFHVWVEGWMKRPDLSKSGSYDGWQVLDPTPQELSDGVHCCGPAPIAAILRGEVNLKYDIPFVFSEVNADIVRWKVSPDGSRRKMHSDSVSVGMNISTKSLGCDLRDDITSSYKYREGSAKERSVYKDAVRRLNSGGDQEDTRGEELKVEMRIEKDATPMKGQDIKLQLKLRNKDHSNRTMAILVNGQAMRYNGMLAAHIHRSLHQKTLLAGQDATVPIRILFSEYSQHMVDTDSVKVTVIAIDEVKDELYETETNFSLHNPLISIKVLGQARLYQTMNMTVEFTNPLNETLKNCSLTVVGGGLFKPSHVGSKVREVAPKSTLRLDIATVPYKAGLKVLVADFDCNLFRERKLRHRRPTVRPRSRLRAPGFW